MTQMLADGRFTGIPFDVIGGGLTGAGEGLGRFGENRLRESNMSTRSENLSGNILGYHSDWSGTDCAHDPAETI
ncbi:hypothetical protein EAE99_007687 [Botrytis elliptica]|nr:hypothetical protein EAE99_007687 [Botrytis elliptica]